MPLGPDVARDIQQNLQEIKAQTRDIVLLESGIDLWTPATLVKPGALIDCKNYEISNTLGLKRIDGYQFFDGRKSTSRMYWHTIVVTGNFPFSTSYPVYIVQSGSTKPFGAVCEVFYDGVNNLSYIRFFAIDTSLFPLSGTVLQAATLSGNVYVYSGAYIAQNYPNLFDDSVFTSFLAANFPSAVIGNASDAVRAINRYHAFHQGFVRSPYTNDTSSYRTEVVGVHLFRTQVYSFCNTLILGFANGSTQIYPGDFVSYNQDRFVVIRVVLVSGSWSGGTAQGYVELDFVERDTSLPPSTNLVVHRPVSGALTVSTSVSVEPSQYTPERKHAVIRKSYSEHQAIDKFNEMNRMGWNRVPTMWYVRFREGRYTAPDIPVINRRTGNLGTTYQTGNTSATAPNGSFQVSTGGFYFGSEPSATSDADYFVLGLPNVVSNFAPATQQVDTQWGGFRAKAQYLTQVNPNADRWTPRVGLYQPIGVSTLSPLSQILGIEVIVEGDYSFANNAHFSYPTVQWSAESKVYVSFCSGTTKISDELELVFVKPLGSGLGVGPVPFTLTLGSPSSLWNISSLNYALLTSPNFGLSMRMFTRFETANHSGVSNASPESEVRINRIYIIVYYQTQFTKYYFHNAGEDIEADVVACYLEEGSFIDGTAKGVLQITNITPLNNMDLRSVLNNWTIHTAPGGATGTYVATVDADMTSNAPESLEEIRKHSSKYRFITSNFYGDSDWDAVYGTSGAGRGFALDKDFFVRIFTQPDEQKDKPRHVANHHHHLALGFSSGNVDFSVVGEPEDFSGVRGATSIAVGDEITGLVPMPGKSLGVFCDKSVWTIQGAVADDFQTSLISPNIGAIEYTAVGFGAYPIYTSTIGITTLEQSERYGDFFGTPLSAQINRLLIDRIQNLEPVSSEEIGRRGTSPILAIPCRSKNQYRLMFEDGTVITLTARGGAITSPAFTIQEYWYANIGDFSAPSYRFIVRAASSEVDSDGVERIHLVPESVLGASGRAGIAGRFVYEFDKNWSFIDRQIPAYFVTNYYYGQNPFDFYVIRKIRFEGIHYGTGRLLVRTGKYTSVPDSGFLMSAQISPLNFPKEDRSNILVRPEHDSSMVNVAEGDRTILVRVENSNRQSELLGGEPSHTLQVMLVQMNPGGKPDG